jgi:hypothetical protein
MEKRVSIKYTLDQSGITTQGASIVWNKEGWLVKLSGYVWKSWEKRYFRLTGNKLAYYKSPSDLAPRRVIQLDGCTVDITSSGAEGESFTFTVIDKTCLPPHPYYLCCDDHQEMEKWVCAIQRASVLFLEIFYGAVARDTDIILEYCSPHWSGRLDEFHKLIKEVLQQKKFRLSLRTTGGGHRKGFLQLSEFRACYVISGDNVFFGVVDKRVLSNRAEAFVEDLRERFESVSLFTTETLKDFGLLMRELMEVYSPGYEAKDPAKVRNATLILQRVTKNQTPEQMMQQLLKQSATKDFNS